MLKLMSLAATALIATTAMASAHDKIDRMQARQADRIEAGRLDGSLTFTEGRKLRREQTRIARLEKQLRASGGGLSKSERRVLRQLLRAANHNIRDERHDAQRRAKFLPRVGR